MGVHAFVVVSLIKDGQNVAGLVLHQATPRDWTPLEISLLEETAERTWAAVERARTEMALADTEERLRQFGEASQDVL